MYKDAHYQDNTLSSMFRRMKPTSSSGTGDLHPGQLYNWQDANVYNDRDYAIEVIYVTCKFCWVSNIGALLSTLQQRKDTQQKDIPVNFSFYSENRKCHKVLISSQIFLNPCVA